MQVYLAVCVLHKMIINSGADPGFQVRGGGALKKTAPSGGGRENFGVFRVKNHDFRAKNHIFSNFRGGGGRRVRPLSIRPLKLVDNQYLL